VVTSELPVSNPAPRMKEASMRPAKPKIGETRYVEGRDGTRVPVVISGRETHNHFEFYRAKDHPGALWLARSLRRSADNARALKGKHERP
jgi:hypothetical protein